MFEKTLTDLVTGIRSHKRDTALFISQNIAEIKNELQSSDLYTKSNALQKLTFLQSMGYSMSWAAFSAVEVMSSPRFALKRVGYLAATQVRRMCFCVYLVFISLLVSLSREISTGISDLYADFVYHMLTYLSLYIFLFPPVYQLFSNISLFT